MVAQYKLNQLMRRACSWLDDHGLSPEAVKTELLAITRRRIPLRLGMKIMEVTSSVGEVLGVVIGRKMTNTPRALRVKSPRIMSVGFSFDYQKLSI